MNSMTHGLLDAADLPPRPPVFRPDGISDSHLLEADAYAEELTDAAVAELLESRFEEVHSNICNDSCEAFGEALQAAVNQNDPKPLDELFHSAAAAMALGGA